MKHVDKVQYHLYNGDEPVVTRHSSIVPNVGERVVYEDLLAECGTNRGVVDRVTYELREVNHSFTIAHVYLDDTEKGDA